MLDASIIHPSVSSYSSSILLVYKKDGLWWMYVDFWALNKLRVKDKFPILIIDELLNELHSAKYFSKLDLFSDYHQIHLHEEYIPKMAFHIHEYHY